jgi:hypothetical protein
VSAFAAPNATMKDSTAALESDHRADEGVERDEQPELRRVLAQAELYRPGGQAISGRRPEPRPCGLRR